MATAVATRNPRRRALLVGINYNDAGQADIQLNGCVNDAADMRTLCRDLQYDEVCVLHDGPWPGKFDAADALKFGVVSRVFPDDQFRAEVDAIVNRLAESAPIALRSLKANFVDAERMDFAGYVALESERHLSMFRTEDTREAFAAKAEKRKPRFKGR